MQIIKKRKHLLALLVSILIVLLLTFFYISYKKGENSIETLKVQNDQLMEVFTINGTTLLNDNEVEESQKVSLGDVITTLESSKAVLIIGDSATLTLDENTTITIKQAEVSDQAIITVVEQKTGTTWSRIKKLVGIENDYSVETEDVVATVRGTEFVTKVENEQTSITVEESSVDVYFKSEDNKKSDLKLNLSKGKGLRFSRKNFKKLNQETLETLEEKLTAKDLDEKWFEFNECLKKKLELKEKFLEDDEEKIIFLRKIKQQNCNEEPTENTEDEKQEQEESTNQQEEIQTNQLKPIVNTPKKLNPPTINIISVGFSDIKAQLQNTKAQKFQFAIGKQPNGTEILNWTEIDSSGNINLANLAFIEGEQYFITALATAPGYINSDLTYKNFTTPITPSGSLIITTPEGTTWDGRNIFGDFIINNVPEDSEELVTVKIEITYSGYYWDNYGGFRDGYYAFDAGLDFAALDGNIFYLYLDPDLTQHSGITVKITAKLYFDNQLLASDSKEVEIYAPLP
jgi:hypothetical protein